MKTMMDAIVSLNIEPPAVAEAGGLVYIDDETPGISRRRCGRGFIYIAPGGERIRDRGSLRRIKALVIPPAWTEVWICPIEHAHIQAIGRDEKARKQYIYHPQWARMRDEVKFHRMMFFGEALPRIRRRTGAHLRPPGLPKTKVLATLLRLLDSTYVRIGNIAYTRENKSFGLTTLRDRHVDISGSEIRFEFRGKRGVKQRIDIRNKRLARIVRDCQEIPGCTLFQYYDEQNKRQPIDSGDVNEYLHEISGEAFTAKDFRTWGGTLLAMLELFESGEAQTKTQAKKNVTQAVKAVARRLGNQPSACRKYYVHPAILESYVEGGLVAEAQKCFERLQRDPSPKMLGGLRVEERVLLMVLERCTREDKTARRCRP
jgi:DNA topoisomerase-1